MNIWR